MNKKLARQHPNIIKVLKIVSELNIPFILSHCTTTSAAFHFSSPNHATLFVKDKILNSDKINPSFLALLVEHNIKDKTINDISQRVLDVLAQASTDETIYFTVRRNALAFIPNQGFFYNKILAREGDLILFKKDISNSGWKKINIEGVKTND